MSQLDPRTIVSLYRPIVQRSYALAGLPVLIAPADPSRVVLIIWGGLGIQYIGIRPDNLPTEGIIVSTTKDTYLRFTLRDDGPVVSQEWWAVDAGGGGTISVIECCLDAMPGTPPPLGMPRYAV